jgi:hypothetical protein
MDSINVNNIKHDYHFIENLSFSGAVIQSGSSSIVMQTDKEYTDDYIFRGTDNTYKFVYTIRERDYVILGVFTTERTKNLFSQSMRDKFGDECSVSYVNDNEMVCLYTIKQH